MEVQSIRWAMPCCSNAEEEQTKCSLVIRIGAVGLGGITLVVGIFALGGIPVLKALGTIGGSTSAGIGGLLILLSVCLKSVSTKQDSSHSKTADGLQNFEQHGLESPENKLSHTKENTQHIDSNSSEPTPEKKLEVKDNSEAVTESDEKNNKARPESDDQSEQNLETKPTPTDENTPYVDYSAPETRDNTVAEKKQEPIVEVRETIKTSSMSYELKSHKGQEAECTQYLIDTKAPVKLTLFGPRSYCYLKRISDPKLKEILINVGIEFERTKSNTFFNFSHTFTPTTKNEDLSSNDNQVVDIFNFINSAVYTQTNNQLDLDLADMRKLVVSKAEDRTYNPSSYSYELSIEMSEECVASAKKAGLVFEEFGSFSPSKGERAFVLGVGQTSIF